MTVQFQPETTWTADTLRIHRAGRGLPPLDSHDAEQVLATLQNADLAIQKIRVDPETQPAVTFTFGPGDVHQ